MIAYSSQGDPEKAALQRSFTYGWSLNVDDILGEGETVYSYGPEFN